MTTIKAKPSERKIKYWMTELKDMTAEELKVIIAAATKQDTDYYIGVKEAAERLLKEKEGKA